MSQHVKAVESLLDAYFTFDHQRVLDPVTEDFTWLNMALPKARLQGRSALARKLAIPNLGLPVELEEAHHKTLLQLEEGNVLMHERIDRMRFRGQWLEVPCAAVFRFESEKIALWKDFYDIGGVIRFMADIGITLDTRNWF